MLWSTGSRCTGFSSCGSRALERRLGSRGVRARVLYGMRDLPGTGLKPVSPALAGSFLTTVPRGKPLTSSFFPFFLNKFIYLLIYLFLAVLGLRFCARAFSSCGKRGPLFIAARGPLTVAASLVAEHKLQTRRLSNCGSRA